MTISTIYKQENGGCVKIMAQLAARSNTAAQRKRENSNAKKKPAKIKAKAQKRQAKNQRRISSGEISYQAGSVKTVRINGESWLQKMARGVA